MPRSPEQEALRRPLLELHDALLRLHKVLLESERVVYEKDVEPIRSPNHFFQLLTSDPWFAWLRPISQLIVAIDETLDDDKEGLTNASVDAVMRQAVFLLIPARERRRVRRALRRGVATRSARGAQPCAGGQADWLGDDNNLTAAQFGTTGIRTLAAPPRRLRCGEISPF